MKRFKHNLSIGGTASWNHEKEQTPVKLLLNVNDKESRQLLKLDNGELQPCAIEVNRNLNPHFRMEDSDMASMGMLLEFFIPDGSSVNPNSFNETHQWIMEMPGDTGYMHFSWHVGELIRNPPPEASKAKFLIYQGSEEFKQPRKFWFAKRMERHSFIFCC